MTTVFEQEKREQSLQCTSRQQELRVTGTMFTDIADGECEGEHGSSFFAAFGSAGHFHLGSQTGEQYTHGEHISRHHGAHAEEETNDPSSVVLQTAAKDAVSFAR